MAVEYFNIQSVNLAYNNVMQSDGQLIWQQNCTNFPYGALSKRMGYGTFLANPDNAQVNSLFLMPNIQNSGSINVMRASGSLLYYSTQGTANFQICGNGTIANGAHFGECVQNTTLVGGDGVGSTRYTTDGMNFTNATLAPIANFFAQYQSRAFAAGSNNIMSYSVAGDVTNWAFGGTADSSSFTVPGEGSLGQPFVVADRLAITKSRGKMYTWDGQSLVDLATNNGPYSPWSIGNVEDYRIFINQMGMYGFDGNAPQLLSNPIQRAFYNSLNKGIPSANFGSIPGVIHFFDYFASVGSFTDDFTGKSIGTNAVLKYDYQKNAFGFWQLANNPTAWLSYNDATNARQLIFGDNTGQTYKFDRSFTGDNGAPISSEAVFLFTYASTGSTFTASSANSMSGISWEKRWKYLRAFFAPGCEINVEFAFSNSLDPQRLKWSEPILIKERGSGGDFWQFSDGVLEIRFPNDPNNLPRSRFLFVRYYESSNSSSWCLLGQQCDAEPQLVG